MYRGYQDSRLVIDAEGIERRRRASALGIVLVDGQLVGSAQRTVSGHELRVVVETFRPLADDEWEVIETQQDGRRLLRTRVHRPSRSEDSAYSLRCVA